MTTLRAIGRFAGAVALAVALAGCGDDGDGDTTAADDTGSVAGEAEGDDTSESQDDATEQEGDDDAGEADPDDAETDDAETEGEGDGESGTVPGVYDDYSEEAVADTSYDTTILFFHASWCPECRAFEQAILDEGVPDGVQILKTDYDTEQELRNRYGVNHQSWFVKVDSSGEKVSDWLGYGEDKSIDTILEQLG